jgi:hypothetical protein
MKHISVLGIDLAKLMFQLHGVGNRGYMRLSKGSDGACGAKLARKSVFLRRAAAALTMTMLICCGAHASEKPASSGRLLVIVIRHAEKPEQGDNLSCQGENRALAIPKVLAEKFARPDFTYVPAMGSGKASKHVRMFQTVTPMAVKQNLKVNSRYAEDDVRGVARDVLKRSGTVLIVWEHAQIPPLVKALGVSKPPTWDKKDFAELCSSCT